MNNFEISKAYPAQTFSYVPLRIDVNGTGDVEHRVTLINRVDPVDATEHDIDESEVSAITSDIDTAAALMTLGFRLEQVCHVGPGNVGFLFAHQHGFSEACEQFKNGTLRLNAKAYANYLLLLYPYGSPQEQILWPYLRQLEEEVYRHEQ